jgi:hypothetical protein
MIFLLFLQVVRPVGAENVFLLIPAGSEQVFV